MSLINVNQPDGMSDQELMKAVNHEIDEFSDWLTATTQASGFDGAPVATFERAVILSFVMYQAKKNQ